VCTSVPFAPDTVIGNVPICPFSLLFEIVSVELTPAAVGVMVLDENVAVVPSVGTPDTDKVTGKL